MVIIYVTTEIFFFNFLSFYYSEDLLERLVQKGGTKSLLILLTKSKDADAQRFAALALGNAASAGHSSNI